MRIDDCDPPRLAELEALGLGDVWLSVAREIGAEQFLRVWRILDAVNEGPGPREEVRLRIPLYARWQKRQRNRLIIELARHGQGSREIQRAVCAAFGQELTRRQIQRILRHVRP